VKDIGRVAVLDRGPMAVRVLNAVAELGRGGAGAVPATMVVHDDPVPDSEYSRSADEVLMLGREAYVAEPDGRRHSHRLDHGHVVDALRRASVDLVWLGSGVVGDPAAFTRLSEAAGIPVVGPPGTVRTLLADRAAVLAAVQGMGLPVPAWSGGPVTDADAAALAARDLGYPVSLVASGLTARRGVRRIRDEAGLRGAFTGARTAASAESGSPDLFVVADPDGSRKVEVDVLTDDAGTSWPLAVRECSLVQDGQAVLDECPALGIGPDVGEQVRRAAARVASGLGLSGIASVQFRVGPEAGSFVVLGVQALPRLNHALTEEVTGLDVVAQTLRLARGEPLTDPQPQVLGHAVQVRLLAQSPEHGDVRAPVRVLALDVPATSGVRVDTALRAGDAVMVGRTPLLAGITVWGRDRAEALDRLRRALEGTVAVIEGGTTNRSFLLGLLDQSAVRDGTADVGWLDGYLARGGHIPPADPLALVCAAVEAYEADRADAQVAFHARAARGRPELPEQVGSRMVLGYRDVSYPLRVDLTAPGEYRVTGLDPGSVGPIAGGPGAGAGTGAGAGPGVADALVEREGPFERRVLCDGRRHRVVAAVQGATVRLEVDGAAHQLTREDGVVVRAGWPALVVSVLAGPGARVRAGQPVVVLESMKLESPVAAPLDGEVISVDVTPNAQVETGAPLLRIRPGDPGQADHGAPADHGRRVESGAPAGLGTRVALGTRIEPGAPVEPGTPPPRVSFEGLARRMGPATEPCRRVYQALGNYLLGYDLDPDELAALRTRQRRLAEIAAPDDASLLACEDSLLDLFADLAGLFRPRTEDDDEQTAGQELAGGSTQEYLLAYLQSLDADRAGLPQAYRPRLERALARYGVTGLERTPGLEAAVVLLYRSFGRVRDVTGVVTAILERRLHNRDVLVGKADPQLRARFDRLSSAAQGRLPEVAELARDVRFRYLDEPILESVVAEVSAEMQGHLTALRTDPDRADREQRIERLVRCPQPMRGRLLQAWMDSPGSGSARFGATLLEVCLRRYYRIRALHDVAVHVHDGQSLIAADYELSGRTIHVVMTYCALAELPEVSRSIAAHLAEVPASSRVVVEVQTWRPGERPTIDETAGKIEHLLTRCTFGRPLHRLDVTVTSTTGPAEEHFRTQHLTYRQPDGTAFVEDLQYRNQHPMLAKRLELWRLANFRLERLPSAEDVYLFHGVARDNPKDSRLFALAEVRDLTEVRDEATGAVSYPRLERMGLQALAAMRSALAGFPPRQRPAANRMVLSVRPVWRIPRQDWPALAQAFAPLARGAGLQKVVLRVRIPDGEHAPDDAGGRSGEHGEHGESGEGVREAVLHVEGIAGGGVTVTERPVGDRPIRPLTPYQQRVLVAERFGVPYPYEIIRMLAPQADTEAGLPPGRFVELDLGGEGRLVPVDRPPGENTAHVVVGLMTSYTDVVPEGMTRVALLSDPTKGLGNLAEPECRRINAALALAAELQVPVEWFAVSSGALIAMDSGTENMDWIALTLRRLIEHTQAGHEINIVVTGINVGGQPYWNAEATMLMHTKGILVMTPASAMVLTGKQALDFSGGVSAEDNAGIGGFDRVMGPNGQGQFWAPSFSHACDLLLRHYELTYVVPGERFPRRHPVTDGRDRDIRTSPHAPVPGSDFTLVGEVFDAGTNPDRKKPFDMRSVMRAVADQETRPMERWAQWKDADTGIVWDTTVGGICVCMIGLESRTLPRRGLVPADGPPAWTSGTLYPQSSRKTARAINAASGRRPVVVLANLSGFDGSPESMRKWQLEYGAEIGRAVTNFRGPIVFVVVSRYHGGAFVVFSKQLNESLEIAAVEGSFASVIGGAPAAATVFAREVRARTEADPRVARARETVAAAGGEQLRRARAALADLTDQVRSEKLGEVADEFDRIHTVERALRVGSVDRIIEAERLRPYVIDALERRMTRDWNAG
jgi:acetyl/propionyl-CoA carboxylase alpha subunit/acetyl-CoA carboxylase carboxyltransferase component